MQGVKQGPKNKVPAVGTTSLNLAEFASGPQQKEIELSLPLMISVGAIAETCPILCVCIFFLIILSMFITIIFKTFLLNLPRFCFAPLISLSELSLTLHISLSLCELRTAPENIEPIQRAVVPVLSPPQSRETVQTDKDELSAIKAGLRKVKIFTEYVSNRRVKKGELEGSEGRCSARSENGEYNHPFDSDSLDDFEEGESDELKDDSTIRKSFSYGTLAYANCGGQSFYSNMRKSSEDEDWI